MNLRKAEIEIARDTCMWLLSDERYKSWGDHDGGLLWLTGKPGAGKSTLMKFAANHAEEAAHRRNKPQVIVSFFFYGRGTTLQKSTVGFLRAVLHQILPHYPRKLSELTKRFESQCADHGAPEKDWNWHEQDLKAFVFSLLEEVSQEDTIQLFVDALDECGEEDALKLVELFQRLMERNTRQKSKLQIFFSCRQYPLLHLENGIKITPEEHNQDDIRTVVSRILRDRALADEPAQRLGAEIVENARGVFLWAVLVTSRIATLNRQGKSIAAIKDSIRKIPRELHELYKVILLRTGVEAEDLSRSMKLFQWVCLAERRLSVLELQHALAIDPDFEYKTILDYTKQPEMAEDERQTTRMINYLSRGLVEVKAGYVQAIHQTVHDFLIGGALNAFPAATGAVPTDAIGSGHLMMFRTCLRYLSLSEVAGLKEREINTRSQTLLLRAAYPLMGYATTCWVFHACRTEDAGLADRAFLQLIYRTFEPCNMENWLWIHREIRAKEGARRAHTLGTSLSHIAAAFKMPSLLSDIASNPEYDLNLTDAEGRTPLWLAVSLKNREMVSCYSATSA
ncbi:hypothetical protein SLS54_009381 [Diplodia seriata]